MVEVFKNLGMGIVVIGFIGVGIGIGFVFVVFFNGVVCNFVFCG